MNKIGIFHILGVMVAAVIIVLLSSAYIVYQPEQAIVLQFGEPVRVVKDAGLKCCIS